MKLRDRQGKIPVEINDRLAATPEEEADRQALLQNDRTLELMEAALRS